MCSRDYVMCARWERTSSSLLFDFNSLLILMRILRKSKGGRSNATEVPGMLQGVRRKMGVYIHIYFFNRYMCVSVYMCVCVYRVYFYFSKYHIVLDLLNLDIIKLKRGLT